MLRKEEDNAKRERWLDSGKWTSTRKETKIYGRALDTQDNSASIISKTRRKNVLAKLLEKLPAEEKKEIGSFCLGMVWFSYCRRMRMRG
jgi:hypothetical protein